MDDRALLNAQAFAEAGFGVFSVWGADGGICRCPKGPDCTSPGKHPIPHDGLKSATTDTERVAKMLAAAGSQGQYGIVPAPNVIVLDVDGEGWMEKLRALALPEPKTLAVKTANGVHLYFHWPESYGPQPTRLFDWVVRSQQHPGYVIGPGSVHVTGVPYEIAHQNGYDTHQMIATIRSFPVEHVPKPATGPTTITVGAGVRRPEDIPVGQRYPFLVTRARALYGGGLSGQALVDAVWSINLRFREPKTMEDVLRAIGDVERKFEQDPFVPPAEPAPIPAIATIVAALSVKDPLADTYLVQDLVRPKSVGVLVSRTGLGKSYLRTELGIRMATGTGALFGKYAVNGQHDVMVYDAENGPDEEHRREDDVLDALSLQRGDLMRYRRAYVGGMNLSDPRTRDVFAEHMRSLPSGIRVWDTIGMLSHGREWGDEMYAVMGWLRQMAQELGEAHMLLAHFTKPGRNSKGESNEPTIDDVMGHWARFSDYVITLTPTKDDPRIMVFETHKRIPHSKTFVKRDVDGLWEEVATTNSVAPPSNIMAARRRSILEALLAKARMVEGDDGVGHWLEVAGLPTSRPTIFRDMKTLEAQGFAAPGESGIWSITDAGVADLGAVRLRLVSDEEGG